MDETKPMYQLRKLDGQAGARSRRDLDAMYLRAPLETNPPRMAGRHVA